VEAVDEILAEFWEKAERCSRLMYFGMRVFDRIMGPFLGHVRLADRLEEAVRWLWAVQVELQEADYELEGLWNSAAQVQDLVLGGPTGMSSLAVMLSSATEPIDNCVATAIAN
jgi:hypothetical protein